ncbi:MAG: glycosyltransferase [Candidatus Sericytochromatia bacterium]
MSKKISVLIVSNPKDINLKNCLESVLNQTLKPFEIILLDNSDYENSNYNNIKSYLENNSNIIYIKNNSDNEYPKNFKKLFDIAKGDYIKFLPSYSYLEKSALEKMSNYLDNHQDVTLVTSKRLLYYKNNNIKIKMYVKETEPIHEKTDILNGKNIIKKLLSNFINNIGDLSSTLFRKSDISFNLFENEGFIHKIYPELLTWIQLLKKGNLAFINEDLIYSDYDYFYSKNNSTLEKEIDSLIFSDLLKNEFELHDKLKFINIAIKEYETLENKGLIKNIDIAFKQMKTQKINKNKSVSIIIVTYNSMSTIEECIEGALSNLDDNDEIIIVDNDSRDNTPNYLKTLEKNKQIKVFLSKENLGFSKGVNLGIKNSSNKDTILLLNPDAILTENSLSKMINHLYSDEKIAAVGPISDGTVHLQNILAYISRLFLNLRLNLSNLSNLVYHIFKNDLIDAKLLIGFCMCIKKDLLDKYGYLEETLFVGSDDLELCWRLKLKGYDFKVCLDTFVHHVGRVSFKTTGKEKMRELDKQAFDALIKILFDYYGKDNIPTQEELWEINWFGLPFIDKFNSFKEPNHIEKYSKLAFNAVENLYKNNIFDLNENTYNSFINFHQIPLNNIFDKDELERKLFILSAVENISYNNNLSRFDTVNLYINNSLKSYGLIKGVAEGFNKYFDYNIKIDTNNYYKPLVSVILYSKDIDTFKNSLESILRQTYKNIEIFVANNSKIIENDVKELESYYNKKINLVNHETNNYSEFLDIVIKNIKGEYIKTIEDKEYLLPASLEILIKAIKYSEDNTSIIFDNYSNFYLNDNNRKDYYFNFNKLEIIKLNINENVNILSSSLIKKSELIKLDKTLNKMSLFDFFNKEALKNNLYKIDLTSINLNLIEENFNLINEEKRIYKDLALDKIFKFLPIDKIFNIDDNKEILDFIYLLIENKNILPNLTINLINTIKNNINLTQEKREIIINTLLGNNNKKLIEEHLNNLNLLEEHLIKDKINLIDNYLNYIDNISKIAILNSENKPNFDFYFSNDYSLCIKKDDKDDGHIIISSEYPYSIMSEKWIDLFNNKADQIWVKNNFTKKLYSTIGIVNSKIKVVGYNINENKFVKKERKNCFDRLNKINFLTITKFNDFSGIKELIDAYSEAFNKNDNVCLILATDKIHDYTEKLNIEKYIESKPNLAEILIFDDLGDLNLVDVLNSCDFYIQPYKIENRGEHIINAMLCEIPVIVTSLGCTEDFCTEENSILINAELLEKEVNFFGIDNDNKNLLYFETDKDAFVNKLKNAYNLTKDECNNMGKLARENIISLYSKNKIESNIILNIEDLIKTPITRKEIQKIKNELYQKSQDLIKNNNFEDSIEYLSDLCKYEKNDEYFYLLGLCQYKTENFEDAINSFSEYMELGRINKEICLMMAECLENIGSDEEALFFKQKAKEF